MAWWWEVSYFFFKKSIFFLFQIPTRRCSRSVSSFHRSRRASPTHCLASTWSCATQSCGVNSARSAPRWSLRNVEGEQTLYNFTRTFIIACMRVVGCGKYFIQTPTHSSLFFCEKFDHVKLIMCWLERADGENLCVSRRLGSALQAWTLRLLLRPLSEPLRRDTKIAQAINFTQMSHLKCIKCMHTHSICVSTLSLRNIWWRS